VCLSACFCSCRCIGIGIGIAIRTTVRSHGILLGIDFVGVRGAIAIAIAIAIRVRVRSYSRVRVRVPAPSVWFRHPCIAVVLLGSLLGRLQLALVQGFLQFRIFVFVVPLAMVSVVVVVVVVAVAVADVVTMIILVSVLVVAGTRNASTTHGGKHSDVAVVVVFAVSRNLRGSQPIGSTVSDIGRSSSVGGGAFAFVGSVGWCWRWRWRWRWQCANLQVSYSF